MDKKMLSLLQIHHQLSHAAAEKNWVTDRHRPIKQNCCSVCVPSTRHVTPVSPDMTVQVRISSNGFPLQVH